MKRIKLGFTLIELLVVVSIIALLVSILLPALSRTREQARKAVCASNFHQVGLVYQAYSVDHEQWLPRMVSIADKGNLFRFQAPINYVIPCEISATLLDMLCDEYGTSQDFWMCPSLLINNKQLGLFMLNSDDTFTRMSASGTYYDDRYRIGMINLVGLSNITGGQVPIDPDTGRCTIAESACRVTDPGYKLLAADYTVRWEDWSHDLTYIAHPAKGGTIRLPAGANRLHVDGSVDWNGSEKMGWDMFDHQEAALIESEQLLGNGSRVQGKYDHWPSAGRDYYW